jgi:flagellar M-ring protein FliF
MSFDQVARTTATVDPDKQVVAAESKNEIQPVSSGGAGQNTTSTTYENTRSTEQFVAAPGSIKRLTVAVIVADKAAPANSKAPPTPRTAAELAQLEMLVRSAVGADSTRGDVVSVVSMPFAPPAVVAVEAPKTDVVKVMQTAQRPLLGVIGLALIIMVAMMSLKSLKSSASTAQLTDGRPQVMSLPRGNESQGPSVISAGPLIPVVLPTNTMRDKVNSTIEQQPDVAARVVRAWLKEA